MRKLDEGETFIVTRNPVPVGELTPLRRHRFVAAEAAVALFRTAPTVDAAGLLDAALSAEDHVAFVAGLDDPDLATT